MKTIIALLSAMLTAGLVSSAPAKSSIPAAPKDFSAFFIGSMTSCNVQINWKRDINDVVTDYKVYRSEDHVEMKSLIPYDATLQPITVVDPTGKGQRGAYATAPDNTFTYVPIQVDNCGDGDKKYTDFYIVGTNIKTGKVTTYKTFSLTKQLVPQARMQLNSVVELVPGTLKTYKVTWSYQPQMTSAPPIAGFFVLFGEKDVSKALPSKLGSVYVPGIDQTSATFTLHDDMKKEDVAIAMSVIDTSGAILSPTNAGEISLVK